MAPQLPRCTASMALLDETQKSRSLLQLPLWRVDQISGVDQLVRNFEFKSYLKGAAFVDALAKASEGVDHHPRLVLQWRSVEVSWWTHDCGGVTSNDVLMAQFSEQLHADLGS